MYKRILLLFLGSALGLGTVAAQAPSVVQWSGQANLQSAAHPGDSVSVTISGVVQDGWHVYGLSQLPDGPTPLKVTIAENGLIKVDGAVTGTPAVKHHDESFNLETQTYSRTFALTIPVRVKLEAVAGHSSIPVAVRFQACSDRVCLPPRTVQIAVPLEIAAKP